MNLFDQAEETLNVWGVVMWTLIVLAITAVGLLGTAVFIAVRHLF
ncbi:MAG: hypothetical protein P4L67_01635 [Candidatus Pacebacteria bacterium]|nr:hypothetical protein [Candidatus Paceibacterota bacterium]